MIKYRVAPSGRAISRRIADCLEATAPPGYQHGERIRAILAINDILQGRSSRTVDELLLELEKCDRPEVLDIRQDISNFQRQQKLLPYAYTKDWYGKKYLFNYRQSTDGRQLKIISQGLYDIAAREGFTPDFFREAYFDGLTFYCLPDRADFLGSEFHQCKFAVCRVASASFLNASIYNTEFYSSILSYVDLCGATLAHTHFRDCELSHVMAQTARLKRCGMFDCTMDGVDYAGATLDGCSFGRMTARNVRLDYAIITQDGATEEECRRNRQAIYQALGVTEVAA